MIIELVSILSALLAIVSTVYLFITATKCSAGLKSGLMFMSVGVLIALAVHSIVEALEIFEYVSIELLTNTMPVLVFIGSVLLIIGTYQIYKVIGGAYNK